MLPLGDWNIAELFTLCLLENLAMKFGVPAPPISSLDVCAEPVAAKTTQNVLIAMLVHFMGPSTGSETLPSMLAEASRAYPSVLAADAFGHFQFSSS
jgi:hypothetical protein